jgi:hypothetical protein
MLDADILRKTLREVSGRLAEKPATAPQGFEDSCLDLRGQAAYSRAGSLMLIKVQIL